MIVWVLLEQDQSHPIPHHLPLEIETLLMTFLGEDVMALLLVKGLDVGWHY